MLKQFASVFEWTLPYLRERRELPTEVDPMLLVALYGLAGAAIWLPVPPPPLTGQGADSTGSGGCGLMDIASDGGSSDSGGSDSGGSDGGCGGGGCGGGGD